VLCCAVLLSWAGINEGFRERMTDEPDFLDIAEAARFLSVSETSLRRWTNAGALPCLRVGKRRERRFRRADLLAFAEQQPARLAHNDAQPAPASTARPLDDAITLTRGGHLCALYDSELGRATLAVRFILEGLQEGSMVYVVASPSAIKQLLVYLEERRPSLQQELTVGKLVFGDYEKTPRAQIKDFEVQLNKAAAVGTQSFRVFGDVWQMRKKGSAQGFADYEAAYDQFIVRRYPVVTVCAYDVRRFSGVEVLEALKVHRDTFRYPLERALA
jgi:excisionase family DNA binding protein